MSVTLFSFFFGGKAMRIGIFGYGNLGRGVEKAIAKFVRDEVEEIVKQMNALLPEAQKQANKQAAK